MKEEEEEEEDGEEEEEVKCSLYLRQRVNVMTSPSNSKLAGRPGG